MTNGVWIQADGELQDRDNGQDISSPTVSIESLFFLASVFAAERRGVITVDIGGPVLHSDVLIYKYCDTLKKFLTISYMSNTIELCTEKMCMMV